MVLKGLAVGGAIVAVAIAVFAVLTFRPLTPANGVNFAPAPSGNTVVLPNGVAAPQLQPAQPASAPAFINNVTSVNLTTLSRDNSDAAPATLASDPASSSVNAAETKALMGCGGK